MSNDLDLSESDKEIAASGLAEFLAESFTLYAKTHGYHWKVEGPMFRTYPITSCSKCSTVSSKSPSTN